MIVLKFMQNSKGKKLNKNLGSNKLMCYVYLPVLPAKMGEGVLGSNSGGVKPLGASLVSVAAAALPSAAAAARIEWWREAGLEAKVTAEGCLKEVVRRVSMGFAEEREDGEKRVA